MIGQVHTCQLTVVTVVVTETLNGEKPALTAVHQVIELLLLVLYLHLTSFRKEYSVF
jgi:hypothetical protein